MRIKERMKKGFSVLLALNMVLSSVPLPVFAAEGCTHHTEHTAECGYVEAVAGVPCAHVHDENCGYVEAVAEVLCACEATDENGAIVHTEGCGYVAPVTGADCTHVHDDSCGYVAAVEGHECHYECAECAIDPANEELGDEAPVCTCEAAEGEAHTEGCALYAAPAEPVCTCAEACTTENFNEYCDVCGVDYSKCTGTDTAVQYDGGAIDLSTLTETYLISDSGEYTFIGSGNYGIKVESGNPTIVLNNASITVDEGSAIDVASGSNATIFVLGDNTIGTTKTEYSDVPCGGIFVAEGGTVNITSNGTDNILRAHGTLAAAIGGKYIHGSESYNAGSISISNVTVYAYTNNNYAAAIGAAGRGSCGTINITNAVVYAYGAGDRWTSAPGIGNAWNSLDWSDTIPIVIISDSEVHTFRYNPYSDYIGYLGDESGDTYATGSINCGDGGSVKNSTIYCYTGLDATTTDKVVKYGALGGLLKEDGTCEGEHSGGTATCTTLAVCENCGASYGERGNHSTAAEGDRAATCKELAYCSVCQKNYGEVDSTNHASTEFTYTANEDGTTHKKAHKCCDATAAETEAHTLDVTTGKCGACGADMTVVATVTDGTNTYYAADAATLNQAVTAILETGSRTFTVELPANAEAGMITAIRRAICDTEGVADGSIHLTLKGVTTIPGTTNWDGVAFGPRNAQWDENNVEIVSHEEVTQLASVNLPDVTEIGAQAFYFCENLVAVSAPKAQTIGAQALGYTALTSVEFPELTSIPTDMFSGTWTLSSAKFPKVTTIEQGGLLVGAKFAPENNPTPFPLELTAEGNITFNGSNHFNIASQNYSGKVDLVLCCDKADKVTKNEDGTATWQVRDDLSYTFKSITFKHSYVDGKCTACGEDCAHTGGTATCTTLAVCDTCGVSYGAVDTNNHDSSVECENGFCPNGCYEPATLNAAGYYEIDNAGKLFWFAQQVNVKGNREIKGVLTAHIDLENKPWTPIGETGENNNNFRGVFDGQGRTIRGLNVEGSENGVGFFGEVRTGTVKNFTIYGNVVVNTEVDYVGGVIGSICGLNSTDHGLERNGAIIQNITSFVNVTAKAHGIGMIGGFVGYANHQSLIEQCAWYGTFDAGEYRVDSGAGGFIGKIQENTSEVTIRNCGAYGTIKTNYAGDYNNTATIYMGGFLSFSNTNAQTTLENCLFAGRFERGENLTDQAFLGAFGTLRSVNAIKNCYYLGDDGLTAVHSDSNLKPGSDNVEITSVTGEELRSNTIATQLGDHWMQDVHYPIPKDTKAHSDSATYTYTDNGDGTHKATCTECGYEETSRPHTIENHACTDCGAMEIVVSFDAGDFEWKTGDKLYFCRVSGDNEWEEYAFTATVAGDGTVTWTPDRTLYWDGTGEHKLVVIYPDTGYVWDTWYIDEDQSTLENLRKNDHLNSIWSGNPTTDPITFDLKHRLAKVTVNYEAAEGVTVSKAEVYTLTQYLLFDIHTLERKNVAWEEGHDLWINSYHNGNQFTAFVSPDAYAADGNFIKITLSDGSVREVKMNKAVTFAEGSEYTYKVVITADEAYIICADECTFEYTDNGDGTHTATCSKCGYAVTEEHTLLTYSASGNVITGSCSKCPAVGTATITAENTTYKGTAQETATVAYSEGWNSGELTVSYVNNVNAGTATASITVGEATASVEFTIAKAEIDGETLINPEFAKGLIYNGTAQALVTKTGSVDGGYIVYSLSIDGEYTTTIPVATEAGNYRVYWTIECDENHYVDGTPGSRRVTIAKANPEYTVPTGLTATYGDTLAKVELPTGWAWKDAETTSVGNAGTRTFKALYNPDSNNYNTVEADVTVEVAKANPEYTVPTGLTATYSDTLADVELPAGWTWKDAETTSVGNAGTRTFKAVFTPADTVNYNTVEADVTIEVAKAEIDGSTLINPEFAKGLIYNGTAQALVTKTGSVDGGYIVYSLSIDGEYTTTIPVATEAGNYGVYWTIECDENHYIDGTPGSSRVTIAAKDASNATVTLDDTSVQFDGTAKTPGVTSVIVDGKTLNAETDYEVSYSNNIYVGTATVTITFKGNYTGNAIATFTIVRAAAPAIQWPTAGSLTYGQKLSESTLTSEDANGTFAWENGEQIPTVTNSGYVVVYTPKDTVNYDYSGVTLTQTIPVTVSKAPASVETAPAANTLIYTGEAQALVTAGAANNGEMQYSTDNQTWSTAIPKGTNAGEYTVYYKVVGDANHIDTDVQSVVVKIGQLAVAEPTVSGTYTYTGKEQMVTLTGVESYMTVVSGNKAVGAGSYEAVITLDGNHKWADGSDGKVQWSIGKAQAEIAVNTDPITAVYGGTVKLPEATANFGTVTCDTTADKLVNAGTYTVTYTVASTANFDGDSKTVTVTVNPKAITEADVSLNGSLVYTGSELTQAVTVTAGVTYEVTGNKATNVGSYTLTVTASGNYTGSVTKDWSIGKAVATVETAPTAKELTYTGAAQALVTAGTANGGKLVYSLSENGIYAETIPTGTNAGDYMVWYYVQGDDNHADSAKASVKVTIAKAKAEISVNTTPITVTYGEAVMLPTATSSFGTVSRDKTAAELVNAGTYTVTYTVEGTANYEGDTKTLTVIVEKKAVAEPAVTGTYTYTGEEQTAQLTGVESCMTIASGDKATNAGSYEVVITLDGNHKWADGSDGKVQWSIGKAEFGDVYVSQSGMLTYNGTAQTPNVNTDADSVGDQTATFAYRLTENESYGEMPAFTDAGTYTVYYKASAPNHKDATGSFTVTVDKAKAEIAVNTDPITVVYGEAVVLPTATTNFGTVACDKTASDLVNAGTYTVTYSVAGSDNYNGDTKTITVTVNAKVVNQPVIEGIEAVYILSENAITPVPTAVKDGATVIDPSEYTLAYENNTAAGTATVKIVDKDGGNYTVNGSMTFQIVEHEHTWTYTTDSNASKIIATCSNADGHCPNTNGGSVSIQDPDELTYDGSTKDAELVYESWQPEEVTITYNNVDRVNVTGKEIVASIGVVGAGIQSVYTIVAAALPNATLSADSGTYTGQVHTVTVVLDTLVKDTDYTVSIPEDMTNVGTKTITVNGKGNYEGTQNLTYTITKRSDVAAPAPGVGYTIDYAKETITIAEGFEVIDSDGKAVVSGSAADYFGKMLSVRYAETQNTEASAYTSFTLAERPAVPNVTIHNETIKGKADGKITGLDTTMEYSTDGGKHWVSVETTDAGEKNLTVGTTIAVRMKATQTAPCSESKTGTVAAGAAITVTYAENGQAADGMPAQVSDLSYGNKLTKPADPTAKNTDFAFRGWYKDAACTTAWDFAKDTVTEETVTLYAKWEQVYFSVTAEIKDHNNVEYHGEVEVKLMRGDSTIDSVTGTAGSFQFSRHVEGGMYNLVAIYTDSTGEHTKTELITVDHDETFVLKLPAPGVNSHLTVSDNAQTPDVMVGELDAEAESIKQQTGATKVEIEMTVTGKTENQVPATVVNAVEEATDNAAVEYLDITVTKQIDDGAKTEMSETTNLMEIVVPYNTNGKTNLRVFRHHDGQLQEFAQGRDADQTFYYASGYIHIFTKYFSNYMISYEVSHTVTFDANGGTVGTNSLTTQTNGTLSTLPTPTREHYVFKGWYTAKSGGTKVTTDTVFNGDATIYAQWGGYAITVADAKNGTVTVDRSEAPGATEITITVTPKTGYKMSAMTVKDAAGKSYVISTDNNGKYYFTMPDADVTVKVTFSKTSTSTADTTNPKTGDSFLLVPFSSMAAASLLALAVLMLNKKKLYQK